MSLQGRDLKLDLSGDDVRRLQRELALNGFITFHKSQSPRPVGRRRASRRS